MSDQTTIEVHLMSGLVLKFPRLDVPEGGIEEMLRRDPLVLDNLDDGMWVIPVSSIVGIKVL